MSRSPHALLVGFCCLLLGAPAFAQTTRTWVSGVGDDANPCSRTAPCKTFAGAISKTAAGGEINALDPGGFGAVAINKAITIDGHGTYASVLASGVQGIVINAGATDVVTLRGLSINGAGSTLGTNGIRIYSAQAVHIEDTHIFGFSTAGIDLSPTTTPSAIQLFIKNTVISEAGTSATTGKAALNLTTGSTVLDHVQVLSSNQGIAASGDAKVSMNACVITGNATTGVSSTGTAEVNVDHSLISDNGTGIDAGATTVRISDTMFSHNATALNGSVVSFGNNRLNAGNTANGTITTVLQQQ